MNRLNGRLQRLEAVAPTRTIYKIAFCTHEQAAALEAERPPAAPGEIRYIVYGEGVEDRKISRYLWETYDGDDQI